MDKQKDNEEKMKKLIIEFEKIELDKGIKCL
jgi:hypothetical protein